MRTEGSIERKGLPDVLLALGKNRRTGILTIQGRDEIIAFAFLKGAIVSADALNQTMEDGLGEVLNKLGLISESDFASLAAEYQAGGGQVVDLLVERGFVQRAELLEAVRAHTYGLCRQVLGWTQGDYKFYEGEEVSYEEGVAPLPPVELLVRASRDLGLELLAGGVPPPDAVYRRASAGEVEGLDARASAVLELIDGKLSVRELAEQSGVSEFQMAYVLSRWERGGLIERSGLGQPRPPAVPAPGVPRPAKPAKPVKTATPPRQRRPPRRWRLGEWFRALSGKPKPEALPWPSRILGLGLVALFVASFSAAPSGVLLPFPWQRGLQESLDRERATASLSRLRRANTAYFLLHGRFAEELSDLAGSGLLPAADFEVEEGEPLTYSATTASYLVRSSLGAEPERETLLRETIRGNFLLDPELRPAVTSRGPLLVLLD